MSDAYPPSTLQFPDQDEDDLRPIEIDMGDEDEGQIDDEGIQTHPDGSMSFPFGPQQSNKNEPKNFDDNLAEFMDESELNQIAADLLRGIEDDIQSSAVWRDNLALGIKLLGTTIEPASTDAGTTSTVLEGQHKTTHPLLLEACLTFQANARASLLPAAGPVKIRDDRPQKATQDQTNPMMGHNGGPPMEQPKPQNGSQPPPINISLQGQPGQQPPPQHAWGGRVGYAEGGGVYDTYLDPDSEAAFGQWKQQYAPHDSGEDYDLRGAFKFGASPDPQNGHWPDTWKKPNHPTFSDQSQYARGVERGYAGHWDGDQFQSSPVTTPYANGGGVNGYADGGSPFSAPMGNGMNGVGNFSPPMGGSPPGMGQVQQPEPPKTDRDILAEGLETELNHYFTVTDKNYYPDTDMMLFQVGHSGGGIKKVYNHPLKRRPVSESCPIEDFFVSNAFADLSGMPRITQRIEMRPSVLRRMQLVGAYRDVELAAPTQDGGTGDEVKQQKAETVGIDISVKDNDDLNYEIYECYCELELDQFAPDQFKDKGLPLPYRVVIAKESEKVLEIRRNWKESDKECTAKEYFVDFSYVKAFGFYPLGLMHILGNTTRTLTAAWREFIDSGMFANFPGFVFAKGAGRQLTNNFRVPPGGGVGLDVGLADIRNAVMPLPYKDLTAAFVAFIQHVEEYGQRLGGTANINVGEGKQDAPVGTTLAMIEQATKPLGAVLKRLHSAQGREFQLFKERCREDPSVVRFFTRSGVQWQAEQFLKALTDFDLIPVSDPNNPTHMHRMAKASMIFQAAQAAPTLFDQRKVWNRIGDAAEIEDSEDLLAPPQAPQADPKTTAATATAQIKQQGEQQKQMNDLMIERMRLMDRTQDRQSKEKLAEIDRQMEQMKLASTLAIHSSTQEMSAADRALQLKQTFQGQQQDAQAQAQVMQQDQSNTAMGHAVDLHSDQVGRDHEAQMAQHQAQQDEAQRTHEMQMTHMKSGHEAQMANLQREHEATLHSRKINMDAALKHHATVTGNEIKREQIKQQGKRSHGNQR